MPLRKHAEEMRDTYANEIARTLYDGGQPSPALLASWAKYDAAVQAGTPGEAFRPPRASSPAEDHSS